MVSGCPVCCQREYESAGSFGRAERVTGIHHS